MQSPGTNSGMPLSSRGMTLSQSNFLLLGFGAGSNPVADVLAIQSKIAKVRHSLNAPPQLLYMYHE